MTYKTILVQKLDFKFDFKVSLRSRFWCLFELCVDSSV